MSQEEPTVVLSNGARVLDAVATVVEHLRTHGHTITIDPFTDDVIVEPPTFTDAVTVLETNLADVEAILAVRRVVH